MKGRITTDETAVMSTGERLVYMANQIARNLAVEGAEQAAAMVADHICHFWDPEMRRRILLLAQESPDALSPIAAAAIGQIATAEPPPPAAHRPVRENRTQPG